MSKKFKKLPIFLGIAAWEAYRFYKGKGVFNKVRFKKQHEALSNYLETHYPNSPYSDIIATEEGWSSMVDTGDKKVLIYMTKTDDGTFVFWEKEN